MEAGRPLTTAEAAALNFMVAADFPGFEQLRKQAATARVVGRCECGCPSVDLAVDRNTPVASAAGNGMVADARCRHPQVTHVLLWVEDGYLGGLELSWIDEYPEEFPSPDMFQPPVRR